MNRLDFVAAVAERANIPKSVASNVVDAYGEVVAEQLAKGDDIRLVGFGTFSVREYAERKGKNPATGAELVIPAGRRPAFKASKKLVEAVSA